MLGWSLIRVSGESMMPVLQSGTFAVFKRQESYRDGDIVLVNHPRFGNIVKRTLNVGEDSLWLEGANANSLSRETIGSIEYSRVHGKLIYQIKSGR